MDVRPVGQLFPLSSPHPSQVSRMNWISFRKKEKHTVSAQVYNLALHKTTFFTQLAVVFLPSKDFSSVETLHSNLDAVAPGNNSLSAPSITVGR